MVQVVSFSFTKPNAGLTGTLAEARIQWTDQAILQAMYAILSAMEVLHANGATHGDICGKIYNIVNNSAYVDTLSFDFLKGTWTRFYMIF